MLGSSTAELMGYYYKNLAQGATKHNALQKAKLKYLQSQSRAERMAPFYWAGFVGIGDSQPLKKENPVQWYWWLGGLVVLLSGGYMFYRRSASISSHK